jgi:hypothetical protein
MCPVPRSPAADGIAESFRFADGAPRTISPQFDGSVA